MSGKGVNVGGNAIKHKVLNIVFILLFIVGFAVFLYPIGTNHLSEHKVQSIISDFDESVRELRESAQSGENPAFGDLYADMQAYNLDLYENGQDDHMGIAQAQETIIRDKEVKGYSENFKPLISASA